MHLTNRITTLLDQNRARSASEEPANTPRHANPPHGAPRASEGTPLHPLPRAPRGRAGEGAPSPSPSLPSSSSTSTPSPPTTPPITPDLLTDYLLADLPLHELAERHALTVPQLLDILESPATRALIDRCRRAAQQQAEDIAALARPQALTTLTRLATESPDRHLPPNRTIPPAVRARTNETARKAAAQLTRTKPRHRRRPGNLGDARASRYPPCVPYPESMLPFDLPPEDQPWPGTRHSWDDVRSTWDRHLDREPARSVGLALCDAMINWRDGGVPPAPDLLRESLNTNGIDVRRTASYSLDRVLESCAQPFETLTDLWNTSRANGRLHIADAARSVIRSLTTEQSLEFLTRCLRDRSRAVRELSARRLGTSGFRPIVETLKAVAADDPDPQVREQAEQSWHLVEFGHWVWPSEPGERNDPFVYLTYRDTYYGGNLVLLGTSIPSADIDRDGLAQAVAKVREQHEADAREHCALWLAMHPSTPPSASTPPR